MTPGARFRPGPKAALAALAWTTILLLLLAVLPSAAHARFTPPFYDLDQLHKTTDLNPWMAFLPDPERRHTWQTALASDKWEPLTEPRLGYLDYPIWTWLRVINSENAPKTAILYNERPMVHHLDVRVLDGETVATEARLGFMDVSPSPDTIAGRLSSMTLRLPAGGVRAVLARLETRGAMEAGWGAATVAAFSQKATTEFIILGLFAGIMLSLIIHGVVNWVSLRQIQFGFFVGYALCLLLYGLSVNGFTRVVHLGISPQLWFAGCFVFIMGTVASFLPFTRSFLHTADTMPRMDQWLKVLCSLFSASLAFFVLAPFIPRFYVLTPFWAGCTMVAYASVLLAGALAVRRRLPYARLYLIGDASAFAATGAMAALAQTALIHRFGTILLILPWIVSVHVMVLSLSLVLMARRAQSQLEKERERAMEQSRFAVIGQTIGMVVHQWRTPLARLGTQLTELIAYFRSPGRVSDHEAVIRDDLLPAMRRSMQVLTETVEDFTDFFAANRPPEDYDPIRVMDQVLEMAGGRCARLGVRVIRPETREPVTLHGRPSALAHVLMVLVGNALDVLEGRVGPEPCIVLGLEETEQDIILTVSDNGGGIDVDPIERVFDSFVSEKGDRHMGMGLGLARRVVEDRMGGVIWAENVDGGTRFTLKLPRHRERNAILRN